MFHQHCRSFGYFLLPLAVGFITIVSCNRSIPLSEDLFEELTDGKSVFIKFYAPWCGHCQQLAPAWERLAQTFQTNDEHQSLIAEVDCTKHEEWCTKLGVTAFPTLLYGDPSHGGVFLEEYTSTAKGFEDLIAFADRTLRTPICSPGNIAVCDPLHQHKLYGYWNMSHSELQSTIEAHEKEIRRVQVAFQEKMKMFQEYYDKTALRYELTSSRLKRHVRLLQAIHASA